MATPVPEGTLWAREIHSFQQRVDEEHRTARCASRSTTAASPATRSSRRAHPPRAARRRVLGRHAVHARGAVDAGDARARAVPGARRAQLRARAAQADAFDDEFRRSGFVDLGLDRRRARAHLLAHAACARSPTPRRRGCGPGASTTRSGPALDGLGFTTVRADVGDAGRLYDDGKVDGFIAAPTAALAFQWSARTQVPVAAPAGLARRVHHHLQPRLRSAAGGVQAGDPRRGRPRRHRTARSSGASRTTCCSAGCSPSRGCTRCRCWRDARRVLRRVARAARQDGGHAGAQGAARARARPARRLSRRAPAT